ncbi:molybdopterin-dependent oxidoreductase [Sporichthya brevicatena]|uniref:Molybdopterin-dependent oxidoreductase n=1 Tax=Sporichthya brevicatena TaxID=171442 RepID=A0ABN1GJV3_9ACTN
MGDHKFWCGVCEASCGLEATVEHGKLLEIRPDPTHPNSTGFACVKGIRWGDVLTDPDRVVEPLQRQSDGSFVPVSWETALDDIGRRLREVIRRHDRTSVGVAIGNPSGWNYGAFLVAFGMAAALRTKHFYTAGSVDINNYWVVGHTLYGHNLMTPFPDFDRQEFTLILGANPVVSHGSMMTVGRVRERLLGVTKRGGRVVVVDPRRTETAKLFEHVPIRPDTDAWLLAGMLRVILDEDRVDSGYLASLVNGVDFLRTLVADIDLDRAAAETGIVRETIETLARDFAAAGRACVYGRCGTSTGGFSTLTKYLIDVLNIVTGNLDRPGGTTFSRPMLDAELFTRLFKIDGYDRWRTRVDNFPEVLGTSPLATMPREITTPGPGQLRALVTVATNLATTSPNSPEMERALADLDLFVSLDPYLTETNRHAHYVLPPKLLLEREGFPLFGQLHYGVPNAQWTDELVTPPPGARDDWWILDQICKRIGLLPSPAPGAQLMGKLGLRLPPWVGVDVFMRLGPDGDLFGLRRRGISRKKLLRHNGAIQLADSAPTGMLPKRLRTRSKRIELAHDVYAREMQRLIARTAIVDEEHPLLLFTIRENRSQNSWLHNVPALLGDRVCVLRIHPDDAAARGISTGAEVAISSRWGRITATAAVTDEVMPGTVGLPPHFGHHGGWRTANGAGGGRYNDLVPNDPELMDVASGNARFNGIAVQATPVTLVTEPQPQASAEVGVQVAGSAGR